MQLPMMRNSERNDFKECPQKWAWRWNERLTLAHPPQAGALWFGTGYHLVWAEYYTPPKGTENNPKRGFIRGRDPHETWDEFCGESYTKIANADYFDEESEQEFIDAKELGHIMIAGQLKMWGGDPQFEVLMPEQRFAIGIKYTVDQIERMANLTMAGGTGTNVAVKVVGTYDMPVRDHADETSSIKIIDWKTTSKQARQKQLNKDGQTGTYILSGTAALRRAGLITEKERISGMIFSFARKAKPPENVDENGVVRNKPLKAHFQDEFDRLGIPYQKKDSLVVLQFIADKNEIKVWGERSKRQGNPLFWREVIIRNEANMKSQARHIAEEAEVMGKMRAGLLPIYKSPGEHCNWCVFSDLCDIDEDGGDTEEFKKYMFTKDDPYADHRSGALNSKVTVQNKKETGVQ